MAAIVLALSANAPARAAEPQCVAVKFIDAQGTIIAIPTPIIGLLVAGRPAVNGVVPANSTMLPGAPEPCPPALLQQGRQTFNESCSTEDRRANAAIVNKADRKIIDKGCGDLLEALGTTK